jgi:hypothetical protein
MAGRLLWATMLAGHVPALLRHSIGFATGHSNELATILALAAACAFFVLKIVDVSWLRFNMDRRARCAAIVVVALLHANALQQSTDAEQSSVLNVAMLATAITAASFGVLSLRFKGTPSDLCHQALLRHCRLASPISLLAQRDHRTSSPPRAPPLS